MAYRHAIQNQLDQLFEEAERRKELLYLSSQRQITKLKLRITNGDITRPFKCMYARRVYWDNLRPPAKAQHIIRGLSHKHPEFVFSHTSAAVMHGLEVNWNILKPLHVITQNNKSIRIHDELIQHRAEWPSGIEKDGALITSVEQTVIDCAAYLPLEHSLAIADSALHLSLTNKARLNSYLESRINKRGARVAKKVIELADPRPDNGGESQVRAVMLQCGFPMPDLQVPVVNPDNPTNRYLVDFMFTRPDGVKVAVELDGKAKYEDEEMTKGQSFTDVLRKERRREALITSSGLRVVRFSYSEGINPDILKRKLALYGIEPVKRRGNGGNYANYPAL